MPQDGEDALVRSGPDLPAGSTSEVPQKALDHDRVHGFQTVRSKTGLGLAQVGRRPQRVLVGSQLPGLLNQRLDRWHTLQRVHSSVGVSQSGREVEAGTIGGGVHEIKDPTVERLAGLVEVPQEHLLDVGPRASPGPPGGR